MEQTQIVLGYSRRGRLYGVDTVTKNSGVVYSDYFILNIHYRLTAALPADGDSAERSRIVAVADIEFLKPCLFRGRIEAEAWSGMKKYYDVMDKEVRLEKDLSPGGEPSIISGSTSGLTASSASLGRRNIMAEGRRRTMSERRSCEDLGRTTHVPMTETTPHYQESGIRHDAMLLAFLMVIVVMVLLTLAMFKMNAALSALDQRLERIERIVEKNGRLYELMLEQEEVP